MGGKLNIPFLDLKAQHLSLQKEIIERVTQAIQTTQFIGGEQVNLFETEFASFCGSRFSVGVNSGTDALRFAFMAAGIGSGDTVITVPNTFIATTEAITQVGAQVVFVDVDEKHHQIDPNKLEEVLKQLKVKNQKVKAVVPVHLFGHCSDMDSILELAKRYQFIVIEDACQAHGALFKAKKSAGTMSLAGCFSFYPGKNLGACGEGGAVITDDEKINNYIRMVRDHGQSQKYYHEIEGYNGRLDAIQAGILRIKLTHLKEWNAARRRNAKQYDQLLSRVEGVNIVHEPEWSTSIYHLYVVKIKNRDAIQKRMAEKGVATALHYPIPLHLQNAYMHLGYKPGDFPIAEKHAKEILSLPMYPELTSDQIGYVVQSLKECLVG
jgi:dTDP-4-amino-4,6-dideoxygalactose transaminase